MCYSFTGCLQNLTVNTKTIAMDEATTSSLGSDPPMATPGCPREDTCFPSPCLNGATCEAAWDNVTCHCEAGYWGRTCSKGKWDIGEGPALKVSGILGKDLL